MNLQVMAEILTWISLIVAFIAAILWLYASRIEVKKGDPKSKGGFILGDIDVYSSAREQSRWNSRAALATAVALIVQATSQAISHWCVLANLLA